MLYFQDQMYRTIALPGIPQRIVSLVPSQTELLYSLGLTDEVVGITKFCVHPAEWYRTKTRIGGTKSINATLVASLRPDLILANKEENVKEQIETLAEIAPVWISDINDFEGALQMMQQTGTMTSKQTEAGKLITSIPYMTVGGDTFISDMLDKCGLQNAFADQKRYPEITTTDLLLKKPKLILLSSEPYPFRQKHIDELSKVLPNTRILLADGEMFSWYGSRMLLATDYFRQLLHDIAFKS
ncbi:MAG: helical backbone metal receptor [Sediminibacterium sp.]